MFHLIFLARLIVHMPLLLALGSFLVKKPFLFFNNISFNQALAESRAIVAAPLAIAPFSLQSLEVRCKFSFLQSPRKHEFAFFRQHLMFNTCYYH